MFVGHGQWPRHVRMTRLESIVAAVGSRPAAGEAYDMHIVSIDRAGGAAIAKVAILWNDRRYTDYLAMIRRADGWSISEKTFYSPT
jgi:hypothetical protein